MHWVMGLEHFFILEKQAWYPLSVFPCLLISSLLSPFLLRNHPSCYTSGTLINCNLYWRTCSYLGGKFESFSWRLDSRWNSANIFDGCGKKTWYQPPSSLVHWIWYYGVSSLSISKSLRTAKCLILLFDFCSSVWINLAEYLSAKRNYSNFSILKHLLSHFKHRFRQISPKDKCLS